MKTPDQSQFPDDDLFQWAQQNNGFTIPEHSECSETLTENSSVCEDVESQIETTQGEEQYCPKCQNGGFCLEHQPERAKKSQVHLFENENESGSYDEINKELSLASQHHKPEKPITREEMAKIFADMKKDLENLT